jgi:hypothetical protein
MIYIERTWPIAIATGWGFGVAYADAQVTYKERVKRRTDKLILLFIAYFPSCKYSWCQVSKGEAYCLDFIP